MQTFNTLNDSFLIDKNGEIAPHISESYGKGIWNFKRKSTRQEILEMEFTDEQKEYLRKYGKPEYKREEY